MGTKKLDFLNRHPQAKNRPLFRRSDENGRVIALFKPLLRDKNKKIPRFSKYQMGTKKLDFLNRHPEANTKRQSQTFKPSQKVKSKKISRSLSDYDAPVIKIV